MPIEEAKGEMYTMGHKRSMKWLWALWLCSFLWLWSFSAHSAAKKKPQVSPNRLEWGGLLGPAYNIDTGLEILGFLQLAKFRPGYAPYMWRMLMGFKFSMRTTPTGIEFPIHDYAIGVDLPGLAGGKLRLVFAGGFKILLSPYFGIGNASSGERIWRQFDRDTQKDEYTNALRRYQYRRVSPYGWISALWTFAHKWQLFGSINVDHYSLTLFPDSKLKEDADNNRAQNVSQSTENRLIHGTTDHGLLRLQMGLVWDTRDNEFASTRGWFHEISVRVSPGGALGMRFSYIGANLTLRGFIPLWRDRLVVALRLVGDIVEGQVPFHRLSAFGGLYGKSQFGGKSTIRGVRAARFHGKIKVFGNLELRFQFLRFFFKQVYFSLGAVAFFDAGRVWADFVPSPTLDGTGVGLHFGTGGGIRFQWGKSLVLRLDVAWSSDASPLGFYFNVGNLF